MESSGTQPAAHEADRGNDHAVIISRGECRTVNVDSTPRVLCMAHRCREVLDQVLHVYTTPMVCPVWSRRVVGAALRSVERTNGQVVAPIIMIEHADAASAETPARVVNYRKQPGFARIG